MFRRRRRESQPSADPVDLTQLRPRWRATVDEAVAARSRFRSLVESARAGPMAERLTVLAASIDEGVLATYRTARRAQAAEDALIEMNPEAVNDALKAARRREADAEIDLLMAQHASVNRLLNSVDDAEEQLRMLDLRLDAAVARAAELVLRPSDTAAAEREIDGMVSELESLRQAMESLD
ncbi:MAG: hypothetical protein ACRDJP_14710 [Actinomycetota bacterium]